jgi:hypothetical protein
MKNRASLWRRFAVGLGALGALALVAAEPAQGADHLDSNAASADPAADIGDFYAWTSADGESLNMIMTVTPLAGDDAAFSDATQYSFHVNAHPDLLSAAGLSTLITCQFYTATDIECWAQRDGSVVGYVEGDASVAAGVTDTDESIRVFAGLRNDPFYFNLDGFGEVGATVRSVVADSPGALGLDANGCPAGLDGDTRTALVTQLAENAPDTADGTPINDLDGANVLAIVMQVDLDLVSDGTNPTLSTWASTQAAE